jgi:predicted nucleotidyltransferase
MSHQMQPEQRSFNTVEPLSDDYLNRLEVELDNDDIVGIILGGSYARNEATQFSDVDIACFVQDSMKPPPKRFIYRDGRLLSVGYRTVAEIRSELARPERAIFIVSGFRRVLLDKDGSVSRLMREIETFDWGPLQEAANSYTSFGMMLAAEQVHKILSEILKSDDLGLSYAVSKLLSWLTEAVAVQFGILVKNDSTFYRQVQEAVGLDSEWTRYHRLTAGVDASPGDATAVRTRGIATLYLYRKRLLYCEPQCG